jgi:2',3'-cyclic-nucleotide 2'-phosphodiesterase (5'-nucleotidase family)
MLTGDFLAPYLLSSVDRGAGMMNALAKTPIDYLTWGNHEADIDHRTVCRHVKKFPGIWLNSNMQGHDAMRYQKPYEIIEISSPDGTNVRKIGLVAVLSNDPKLYSHFKPPGAFGGAKIDDPWETLRKYKKVLEEEEGCDMVLPLEHLYVPENHRTCREFDFPVILSGHDHHRVDEIVEGTRLIKPGMDGVFATVLELCWKDAEQPGSKPKIRSTFVETSRWGPCPELKKETDHAYDVLLPLRNTELAGVPPAFEPLSSKNARGSVCTMGRLICSMLKSSLEQTREPGERKINAVILMGGNIRGNEDYEIGSFISLETLEAEIKSDEVIGVVPIPGSVLAAGIEATHAGPPIPGWMQYDDGIKEEDTPDGKTRVTHVAGKPLDPDRIYRVATKIKDLTNGQSPPLKEYFDAHLELLPSKGSYINIQSELMGFFARNLFHKLWEATGEIIPDPEEVLEELPHQESLRRVESRLRLSVLDRDGDGYLTVDDIHIGLRDLLGLSVHEDEKNLAKQVHDYADVTGTGKVTVADFEQFCVGMPKEMKPIPEWEDAFPDPVPDPPPSATVDMALDPSYRKRSESVASDENFF